MELEVKLGKGCKAVAEVHVDGNNDLDGNVSVEVELNCAHCAMSETLPQLGDLATVRRQANGDINDLLTPGCRAIDELGVDPDNLPKGFFPTLK